jgi:hypothetical protein
VPGRRPPRPRRAQAFEDEALVRGMLVDDDEAIARLGDDVGFRDLPARDTQRVLRGFRAGSLAGSARATGGAMSPAS